jgi:uncharacterized membrane protein
MNPLTSIKGSIATGAVLAVIIALAITGGWNELSLARWIHILSGITWIGLLYYFNVVQTPALAEAGAGVSKYVAPRALLWFRWGAVATWLTGVWYLARSSNLVAAFTFGAGSDAVTIPQITIGIGAWMGTIMLFNVWVLIWPNQKKILDMVPATDDEKAKARKTALYASRINFILSIPMVMCMAGATHGLPF